jgi:hypothetical protein
MAALSAGCFYVPNFFDNMVSRMVKGFVVLYVCTVFQNTFHQFLVCVLVVELVSAYPSLTHYKVSGIVVGQLCNLR